MKRLQIGHSLRIGVLGAAFFWLASAAVWSERRHTDRHICAWLRPQPLDSLIGRKEDTRTGRYLCDSVGMLQVQRAIQHENPLRKFWLLPSLRACLLHLRDACGKVAVLASYVAEKLRDREIWGLHHIHSVHERRCGRSRMCGRRRFDVPFRMVCNFAYCRQADGNHLRWFWKGYSQTATCRETDTSAGLDNDFAVVVLHMRLACNHQDVLCKF
mmetsp:Transcript_52862/g.146491  ORF Transcript_52862/g.146491 Transcript_52862/m.146491 type:complete len:214 (+) Transcript_52862:156-797(+)